MQFLGVAYFRKATISFVMFVLPSVWSSARKTSAPNGRTLM